MTPVTRRILEGILHNDTSDKENFGEVKTPLNRTHHKFQDKDYGSEADDILMLQV
jgi:hypothetical protein